MQYALLNDWYEIEEFLERDPYLNIYSLGDLDDFFRPYTTWYGSKSEGKLDAVALLYTGQVPPTLIGLTRDTGCMAVLLLRLDDILPRRFYAHLSPGLEDLFRKSRKVETAGSQYRMALSDTQRLETVDIAGAVRLGGEDLPALEELYRESYPGNWFDPRMLETAQYFGVRDASGNGILSAAGVHVFSPRYRVAALGNITTRPECRNRGYGSRVTAALCSSLLDAGVRIGLNVSVGNEAALSCYRRLGFHTVAEFGEFTVGE